MKETDQSFLTLLYEKTRNDASIQVSMYDIGAEIGLEKNNAQRVAEELIGLDFVEIRTLAGDIGITPKGLQEIEKINGFSITSSSDAVTLGTSTVLEEKVWRAVDHICAKLKCRAGNLGLAFDPLSELLADLKTIDAQMMSARPKTAIVRECFKSISATLKQIGDDESITAILRLVGR